MRQSILILLSIGTIVPVSHAQDPLAIPPIISGQVIDLDLQHGTVEFFPGQTTNTMGANGPLLGPTILLDKDQQVTINVTNSLGEATTLHWHGMHVAPENDGGPHTVIDAGTTWSPSFTVLDKASTHWYHPHLHMHTNEHVIKGIAGLIIVRDDEEAALALPRTYGVDDLPLVVQTKEFDADGQFVVGGALDDRLMVNGTLDPFVPAPAQMVRMRLLNGASERSFNFGFSNDMPFNQIGTDGGLLTAPVQMTRLRLAPGERAEIVVDLSTLQGQSIHLVNYGSGIPSGIYGAAQPGMGPGQSIPGYTQNPLNGSDTNILRIDVIAPTADPITSLPAVLTTHSPWPEASANTTRTFTFSPVNMGPMAIQGPFTINNMPFDMMMINFEVPFENIEIWQLTNMSPIAHPFHVHDVQFYILDINGAPPPANMQGRKDVVLVPAGGGVVRFITRFEDHWSDDVPYMYHCHMLTHEDDGMMGQFLVNAPTDLGVDETDDDTVGMRLGPNPARSEVTIELRDDQGTGQITITDALGREVGTFRSMGDRITIDVSGFAAGTYTVRYHSAESSAAARFVKDR